MLLNQQQSTQSLNKCLIKPLQHCSLVKNENAMKKRFVLNFSPSSWLLPWTQYGTVWHAAGESLVTPQLIIYLIPLQRFLPIKSLQHLLLLGLPRSKFCSPLKLPSNISIQTEYFGEWGEKYERLSNNWQQQVSQLRQANKTKAQTSWRKTKPLCCSSK